MTEWFDICGYVMDSRNSIGRILCCKIPGHDGPHAFAAMRVKYRRNALGKLQMKAA